MPYEHQENANLVESQSSQVLDFVLGNTVPPAVGNNGNQQNASADRASAVASESSGSVPNYHFHGLAATQTESQYTDNTSKEYSQKENTPAFGLNGHPSNSPLKSLSISDKSNNTPPSCFAPLGSVAGSASSTGPLSTRVPLQETAVPFKATKAVTFISPSPPVYKVPSQPPMRFRHRRSPSPSSQDSFAGPSRTQDPDLFVASSRQFDRPLDELGQTQSQSQEDSQSLSVVPRSIATRRAKSPTERVETRSSAEMKSYSLSTRDSGFGRILVENSDESVNNSQASGGASASQSSDNSGPSNVSITSSHGTQLATQVVNTSQNSTQNGTQQSSQENAEDNTQNSDASTELNNGPTQIVEPTNEPNSSQPLASIVGFSHPLASIVPIATSNLGGSANNQSDAPSLFDSLPAHLKQRYARIAPSAPPSVSTLQGISTRATVATSSIAAPSILHTFGPPLEKAERNQQPIIIPSSSSPSKPSNQTNRNDIVPETADPKEAIRPSSPKTSYIRTSSRYASKPGMDEVIPPSEPEQTTSSSGISRKIKELNSDKDSAAEVELSEEEDVPLMTKIKKTLLDKGKQKETFDDAPVANVDSEKGKAKATPLIALRGRALKNDIEVPSSAPHQDAEVAKSSTYVKPTNKRGRKKKTPAKALPVKRRQKSIVEENRASMAPPEAIDELNRRTEEVQSEEDVAPERETATEVADEERMEVDEPYVPPDLQRKRGRARSESLKAAAASSVTRAGKRHKTLAANNNIGNATRVMALWKQDGYYYPGTVHSVDKINPLKYSIHFDDKTEDFVEVKFMRISQLKLDDEIILIPSMASPTRKAKVVNVSQWSSEGIVTVQYNDGTENVEMEITSTDLKIAGRTLMAKWQDRILNAADIIPLVGRKLKGTPSHSASVASASNSNLGPSRALAGKGFVITIVKGDSVAEKEKVSGLLTKLGGTVISDWSDVYSLRGNHTSTRRWDIKINDIKCIHQGDVEQVFLLSDQCSSKPKFLTALALGIPCISVDYLEDLKNNPQISWRSYMLPAGYAMSLNALVSQTVDLHWGNSSEHMHDIMSNLVPPRVLEGKSVLCFGPDLLPKKTSNDETSSSDVGRIIVCMGATEVEAVASVKNASRKDLTAYDYVVIKDPSLKSVDTNANFVHVDWIKQCLISGRLIPTISD